MSFQRIGDWEKTAMVIHSLSRLAVESRNQCLKDFGLKAEGTAKKHISSQDLGWKALKSSTVANKVIKGQSENILVATSTYFQSITSWVENDTAYAGVKRDVTNEDGTKVADIAAVHEFGSDARNIPARKLWRPTFNETLQWSKDNNDPHKIFLEKLKRMV